jgi:class 3 adenylate cyclase/tetratricopeptide (TPR) repeat protein
MLACPVCRTPNHDTAKFCSNCGSSLAQPAAIEGERKLTTVVFADVARSTAIAEQLDPEDWAAIMNGAFRFMNAAVTRYGGTVARLMGDAVLAFFGAPLAHEDDAERAVLAALEIRDAAEAYARTLKESHGIDFSVRVGINSGITVLAFLGDAVKAEYTAMGDVANVASRMQSAARPGTVYISGDTYRLVRGAFEVQPRGPIEVKGKQEPVDSFEVVAVLPVPGRRRGLDGVRSPLVGRAAELALLESRLAALRAGAPGGVVVVAGEAGIGKSRLLAEVRAAAAAGEAPVGWVEGRAISYGQGVPYHPWQQVGRRLIGAAPGDPPSVVRQKLRAAVAELGVPEANLPLYEALLAVDTDEGRQALSELTRDQLLERIADAVGTYIRATMTPAGAARVLVFDDLHWSDNASLTLIERLAPLASQHPLLLVLVLRPDRHAPAWSTVERLAAADGAGFTRIDLTPLDAGAARELLGNLLHIEDLPDATRALILKRTDGNPFFLEEVLRSLIDERLIVREGARWRATRDIVRAAIPETLLGVLSARIDRLPDPARRVAQTASVLGRIFGYRPLSSICATAPEPERIADVAPELHTLAAEELVHERAREPEPEYIFKHVLTQEAAYGLLLRARRRELHARAGAVLEELYPDRLEELAAVLAHHFREGGDPQRAARFALRAGQRALNLHALEEALDHYDRVYWSLLKVPDEEGELLHDAILGWTRVRQRMDDLTGVIDRLTRAESIARALNDKRRLAHSLSWLGAAHMLSGLPYRGVPYLLEADELGRELGDEELGVLPFFFATEQLSERDPLAALEQFDRVIELARKHRMPEIEGHALAMKASTLALLGRFDEADEYITLALEAAPRAGSVVKEADVHIVIGLTYYTMGDHERGLEHARRGAELAGSVNAVECACAGYYALGLQTLERQEASAAKANFATSLEYGDSLGWHAWMSRIRGGLASAELQLGEPDAVERLQALFAQVRRDPDELAATVAAEQLARAQLHVGRAELAEEPIRVALEIYQRIGMRPFVARMLELLAEVRDALSRPEEAAQLRAEAAALRATFRNRPAEPAVVEV